LPVLECLKVTISQEAFRRYNAHGQDPEKENCTATSADLKNALPAPTSGKMDSTLSR
jgi:hypothetical protein